MRFLILLLASCAPGTASTDQAIDTDGTGGGQTVPEPTDDTDPPVEPTPTEPPEPAQDYRLPGPYTVEVRNEEAEVDSCSGGMGYTIYRPNGIEPAATVILAHGWVREKEYMAGWAEHWATWGLAVVTPNLCHAELFDTNHEQNAIDLRDLRDAVAQGLPVLWAGHSAGGLATLLASAGDPTALGHLGLDLVDSEGLGLAVAPSLLIPAALLAGEPTACNSSQNGAAVYADIPESDALLLIGADHCDFESPTDWGCTTFCPGESGDDVLIHDSLLGLSTAWVLWRSAQEPSAAEWWTPGTVWYDQLASAGAIGRP